MGGVSGGDEEDMGFRWEVRKEATMTIDARICLLVNSALLVGRVFKSGILEYQSCPASGASVIDHRPDQPHYESQLACLVIDVIGLLLNHDSLLASSAPLNHLIMIPETSELTYHKADEEHRNLKIGVLTSIKSQVTREE